MACGILVLQPGIEPVPSAVKVQSLNHWTDRKFPANIFYKGSHCKYFRPCRPYGYYICSNKIILAVALKSSHISHRMKWVWLCSIYKNRLIWLNLWGGIGPEFATSWFSGVLSNRSIIQTTNIFLKF